MIRVGTGYDIHRLEAGLPCIIGGVAIPHPAGLSGHSDADVLLHALADALLGALGLGDIGKYFPEDDPKWKGVSSLILLADVAKRIVEARFRVVNIDTVVIAEAPRIAPYVPKMRRNICDAVAIAQEQVNIKATTHERIGSIGRGEGIAAMAVCLLEQASSLSPTS